MMIIMMIVSLTSEGIIVGKNTNFVIIELDIITGIFVEEVSPNSIKS